MYYKHLININTWFLILIDKYLLAGDTLDISQYSEIIPDTSKACQNLEKYYYMQLSGEHIYWLTQDKYGSFFFFEFLK